MILLLLLPLAFVSVCLSVCLSLPDGTLFACPFVRFYRSFCLSLSPSRRVFSHSIVSPSLLVPLRSIPTAPTRYALHLAT